ncbi:MAG: bifunctional 5,10-methylenetetrahydrofolate dehydrogenase/5,10-methenyltetrahydrofolate cyclohydrolase [Candidatus Paceibacteria bacterium]
MLLYGKELAERIIAHVKAEVEGLGLKPCLGIVVVGDYQPSQIYVKKKIETAEKAGVKVRLFHLPHNSDEKEVLALIEKLNKDAEIDGYIVQLPLPPHINPNKVIESIDPQKDVDGFHPSNMGKVLLNLKDDVFEPATPAGIMRLIEHYKISLSGADVVVVGRSNIVGKPIAMMLLHKNATVTICHSKTKNLEEQTKRADVLIVAVGKPGFIKPEMVKNGAYVIDVGTTRVGEKVVGDVDIEVQKKAHVSPVPGGVGPLTVATLLQNTLKAAKMKKEKAKKKQG